MANGAAATHLHEHLRFNPKWWWDPVPFPYAEHLTVELARDLAVIQLKKQVEISRIQQEAINETIQLIQKMG